MILVYNSGEDILTNDLVRLVRVKPSGYVPADIGSLGIVLGRHAGYPEYAHVRWLDTGVIWFVYTDEIELISRGKDGWMNWV